VQVITRDDIQKTGAVTTEDLLRTVAIAVQGNSNTVAASSAGVIASGVSSASLRGLGSQRTLVLINGRRIPGGGVITDSTSVDVNLIPLSAVERVEVLKDGASAIYGSDAIGGVINFILRHDYKGVEASATYGDSEHGGARQKIATGTFGWGDLATDRWNILVTAKYEKDEALFGRQRDFANHGIFPDVNNDVTSGNTFPANINAVDGSFGTRNPLAPANCAPSVVDPLFPPTRCRFDPSPYVSLLPQLELANIYASGSFAITRDITAYAELAYARRRTNTVIQPVPISDQFALPPNHPLFNVDPYNGFNTIILKPSSPFYPTAYVQGITGGPTPDLNIRYRSFGTGLRDVTDISEQPRFVIGAKGTAWGWDFDTSYLYSETKLSERVNNGYPSLLAILPLLNSGTVNLFGDNTPDVQAQLDATQFHGDAFSTKTSIDSFAAKASREIWDLPAGPLALALGGEFRQEKFTINPSAPIESGDISGYGNNFFAVDKKRHVTAFFGELNIPIVKTLEGNVAVRYDDYQGTGSKTTPKFSLRWQPVQQILLRGAYGKGFRAPSLTELFSPQTQGPSAPGLNDPLRCGKTLANGEVNQDPKDCLTQFPITLGGNPNLKPEESDNTTIGVVLEPVKNVSLALDAFKIKLTNPIIFGVEPSDILADLDKFAALVTRGPPDQGLPGHIININQVNLNLGEQKVRGLDVDLRVNIPTEGWGTFKLGLTGTYFDQYEIQNLDGSFSSINGKVTGIANGAGGVIPRWKHYATAEWVYGPWDALIAQNYQLHYQDIAGTFEDPTDPAFVARRVGSYETYDIQGSYSGFKNVKLTVGAHNIFDRAPPYSNAGGQNFFQAGYDPGYSDPRGRFWYGTVTVTFK
jgi:iron complex outermembrane recepter protein